MHFQNHIRTRINTYSQIQTSLSRKTGPSRTQSQVVAPQQQFPSLHSPHLASTSRQTYRASGRTSYDPEVATNTQPPLHHQSLAIPSHRPPNTKTVNVHDMPHRSNSHKTTLEKTPTETPQQRYCSPWPITTTPCRSTLSLVHNP